MPLALAALALSLVPTPSAGPVAVGAAQPTASSARAAVGIDYQKYARDFLERHGFADAAPGSVDLEKALSSPMYARVRLGAFDLRYPVTELRDRSRADEFEEVCMGLLEMQRQWISWSVVDPAKREALDGDLETLEGWVKGWSSRSLATLEAAEERDLFVHIGAKDTELAAAERVNAALATGEFMGLERKTMDGAARIVFAPTRRWFLEWASFAGLLEDRLRGQYWHDGMPQWTKIWSGTTQIVGMEYPDSPFDVRYPERGVTMNDTEKTGVIQHALEAGAASLFWQWYGATDAFFFESALATNLTIEVCGENNVRIGGITNKSYGNSTQPYERFVPGGNPAGGVLPPRDASAGNVVYVPIWRQKLGKEHFVDALSHSQAEGAKKASKDDTKSKDERVHFTVFELEKGSKWVVSAPFFGPHAGKEVPPNPYLDDYEDFFRSYKACFAHWMRTVAGGKKKKDSEAKFSELLQLLATRDPKSKTFDEVVEQVYGTPLSGPDGSVDSMEWRFLTWLAKQ